MPTYNYLCQECGNESEYFGVQSDNHPPCRECGSRDMKRLPSEINITGLEMRSVSAKDLTGPGLAIRSRPFEAQCSCGHKIRGLEIEASIVDCSPSEN